MAFCAMEKVSVSCNLQKGGLRRRMNAFIHVSHTFLPWAVSSQARKLHHSPRTPLRFSLTHGSRAATRMIIENENGKENNQPDGPQREFQPFLTPEKARLAMKDAISLAAGDVQAVAQICATGFVEAFMQCYKLEDAPAIFVVCGPGLVGLIGVYSAIQLKEKGYDAAVHYSHPSKYVDMPSLCARYKMPLYDFIPTTLEFYFQVIVDALLGVGFDGGDIHPPYWQVFEMLISTRRVIASIDVPSGWDLSTGPRPVDRSADTFIKPELLVSLGAPKLCSKMFGGSFHFIAGRHLPQQYFIERQISVPTFPGTANCVLFSSSPLRLTENGDFYGRPGQYNATLYTKNPRREWVDIDEEMDLWDELD